MVRSLARLAVPAALAGIIAFALFLRYTEIGAGLPYIYQDDEGHHFSRLVSMVKQGSYDPHYFNKPSLHFYLRMPVVAVAYVWAVKQGDLTSLRRFEPFIVRWRSSENLTASAFMGVPSLNFTPGRSLMVTVLPPSVNRGSSAASCGWIVKVSSMS